jgi:hypothetical protein
MSNATSVTNARRLSDIELEVALRAAEQRIDELDDAPWPGAHHAQAEAVLRLIHLRAEIERRRC